MCGLLCGSAFVVIPRACFFCFKQKTAYDVRISDWSSDVCSSDLKEFCMARAYGANASLLAAFESTYGSTPVDGYWQLPFVSTALGSEQGLIANDQIGTATCRESVCQYV